MRLQRGSGPGERHRRWMAMPVAALLIAACGGGAATPTPVPPAPASPAATTAPVPTAATPATAPAVTPAPSLLALAVAAVLEPAPSVALVADALSTPLPHLSDADLPGLEGDWILVGMRPPGAPMAAPVADVSISTTFEAEGFISGLADCGDYAGIWTADGAALSIDDVDVDAQDCPDGLLPGTAEDFIAALDEVAGWVGTATSLELRDADGLTLLVYATPGSLDGPSEEGPSSPEPGAAAASLPPAEVPAFVPSDALGWAEVDLSAGPADLIDGLGDTLVGDFRETPAAARIAKLVDQVLLERTPFSWARDIRAWSDGHAAGAVLLQPVIGNLDAWAQVALGGLHVTDPAGAAAFLEEVRAFAPDAFTWSEQTRDGVTIVTRAPNDGGRAMSYALVDDWLLLGFDPASVAIGITASHDGGLVVDGATLPAEGALGAAWLDLARPLALAGLDPNLGATITDGLALLGLDRAILPTSAGARVELDDSGATATVRLATDPTEFAPSPHPSRLADVFGYDTVAYLELHDVGPIAAPILDRLNGRGLQETLDPIEYVTGLDSTEVLAGVRDVAVGLRSPDGYGVEVGLAATLADEDQAAALFDTLRRATAAVSRQGDGTLEVYEEEVAGTSVLDITAYALSELQYNANLPVSTTIQVAVADGRLLLGTGSFVTDALLRDPLDSLASGTAAEDALAAPTLGLAYIDIPSAISWLRSYGMYIDASLEPRLELLGSAILTLDALPGLLEARLRVELETGGR